MSTCQKKKKIFPPDCVCIICAFALVWMQNLQFELQLSLETWLDFLSSFHLCRPTLLIYDVGLMWKNKIGMNFKWNTGQLPQNEMVSLQCIQIACHFQARIYLSLICILHVILHRYNDSPKGWIDVKAQFRVPYCHLS